MSTQVVLPQRLDRRAARRRVLRAVAASAAGQLELLAATLLALLTTGFHPFAEDGGLYAAGVELSLNPALFPHDRAFVAGHLAYSVFVPCIAAVVRGSHLPVRDALFALYVLSLWATLLAVKQLAELCLASYVEIRGALWLTAAWMSCPLAGTALLFVDPYFSPRSIALPCGLFAMTAVLRLGLREARVPWRTLAAALLFAAAGLAMHPLMGFYWLFACALVGMAAWARRSDLYAARFARPCVCGLLILAAVVVYLHSPAESTAYRAAAATRDYWYLGQWRWFEVFGYVAPPLLVCACIRVGEAGSDARITLRDVALWGGGVTFLIAVLMARTANQPNGISYLQPLRFAQPVFAILLVLLGGTLGRGLAAGLRRRQLHPRIRIGAWIAGVMMCALPFWLGGRMTYSSSPQLEVGRWALQNDWVRAFDWIDGHVPADALFALDRDYITTPGEDAQGFRAIARHSMLPDLAKDGGETTIKPWLAARWVELSARQKGLNDMSDEQRIDLRSLGVGWVVLPRASRTALACPYRNGSVQVCQLVR